MRPILTVILMKKKPPWNAEGQLDGRMEGQRDRGMDGLTDEAYLLLDATSHLYKRVCPWVGLSVHLFVGLSVTLSSKIEKTHAFLHDSFTPADKEGR